ncbi:hypothetical protein WJX84_010413 [Apatococcus fuscideae]|uniref:Uncharacterized protein n=1 Tax=Apatococcus fuscideae TaxID=2026836 RepID=A0AAW1RMC2_9CHLO
MPGMQAAMYGGPIPGGLPPAQFAYIQRMMGANFQGQGQPQQPPPSYGHGPPAPQREIITKKDTFDFVTDHLDTLKISK